MSAPALIPSANGCRSSSPRTVTVSTTPEEKSVLPRTRPSPGKCLTEVITPACVHPLDERLRPAGRPPRRVAVPAVQTADRRVRGPQRAGTTSATGARSTLTPACLSWLAPRLRPGGELVVGPGALHGRGRDAVEPGALQALDLAALLVGGDQRADPLHRGGRARRGHRRTGVGGAAAAPSRRTPPGFCFWTMGRWAEVMPFGADAGHDQLGRLLAQCQRLELLVHAARRLASALTSASASVCRAGVARLLGGGRCGRRQWHRRRRHGAGARGRRARCRCSRRASECCQRDRCDRAPHSQRRSQTARSTVSPECRASVAQMSCSCSTCSSVSASKTDLPDFLDVAGSRLHELLPARR